MLANRLLLFLVLCSFEEGYYYQHKVVSSLRTVRVRFLYEYYMGRSLSLSLSLSLSVSQFDRHSQPPESRTFVDYKNSSLIIEPHPSPFLDRYRTAYKISLCSLILSPFHIITGTVVSPKVDFWDDYCGQ